MANCKECVHVEVCGRYAATGGHVRDCKHFATDTNAGRKWIPVTERLPKQYTEVLLWDAIDGERFLGYLDSKNNWKIPGCSGEYYWAITHWMELPVPPKGGRIMEDRCVCCGAIIPEGGWVCPNCLLCVKQPGEREKKDG